MPLTTHDEPLALEFNAFHHTVTSGPRRVHARAQVFELRVHVDIVLARGIPFHLLDPLWSLGQITSSAGATSRIPGSLVRGPPTPRRRKANTLTEPTANVKPARVPVMATIFCQLGSGSRNAKPTTKFSSKARVGTRNRSLT